MKQPLAYVHPESRVAENVVIEPFVTIDKDVVIGEGTRIGSNVTILPGTRIGKNCNIKTVEYSANLSVDPSSTVREQVRI